MKCKSCKLKSNKEFTIIFGNSYCIDCIEHMVKWSLKERSKEMLELAKSKFEAENKGCGKSVKFEKGSHMYFCGNKKFKLCNECSNNNPQDTCRKADGTLEDKPEGLISKETIISPSGFCLKEWLYDYGRRNNDFIRVEEIKKNIKELINLINQKVLTDWMGQNEFVDWLKIKTGDLE